MTTPPKRRAWESKRGRSRESQGYGHRHVKLREQLLAVEPLCRVCASKGRVTAATAADHIIPLAKGGAPYDMSNLQPICDPCHRDKTLRDQGKRVKPTFGADGWPID